MITARELRAILDDLAWDIYPIDRDGPKVGEPHWSGRTMELVAHYRKSIDSFRRLHQLLSDLEHAELHASLSSGKGDK